MRTLYAFRLTLFILVLLILIPANGIAQSDPFDGGDGTEGSPFQISTVAQLDSVRNYLSSHFILTAGLNLDVAPYNTGEGWMPIGSVPPSDTEFTGSFDGNGHVISNLFISNSDGSLDLVGLFAILQGATVKDIGIEGADIVSEDGAFVGILAGQSKSVSIIQNIHSTGEVTGTRCVGGLIGIVESGSRISGSHSESTVTRESSAFGSTCGAGGIVGELTSGEIRSSFATGNVTNSSGPAGGLVGESKLSGLIADSSYASGTVTSVSDEAGGLVGINDGEINNSHATGNAEGLRAAGGLAGKNGGEISFSYATGNAEATSSFSSFAGGLVGHNDHRTISEGIEPGIISQSYALGDVSGSRELGGLVGFNEALIKDSYAWGDVTGTGHTVGGLVGSQTNNGSIENSYAIGTVTGGANSGGLMGGSSSTGTITTSYWNTETSGKSDLGINGEGRTTTEMRFPFAANTYEGWDFETIWGGAGVNPDFLLHDSYPFLLWQGFENEVEALFADGTGTAEDPFQIATAKQLDNVRHRLDSNFVMIADIDLDISPFNETDGWVPIGTGDVPFRGNFDGQNHTITGLQLNSPGSAIRGLFGSVEGNSAETDTLIKNLNLESVNVSGLNSVGGLTGLLFNASVSNCTVSGTVTHSGSPSNGFSFGGLVGKMNGAGIHNSSSSANVTGRVDVGGLVGEIAGIVSESQASGNVTGEVQVGGLGGSTTSGSQVVRSEASGKVTALKETLEGVGTVGGIVGLNLGHIGQSYASGSVSGSSSTEDSYDAGGLVGKNEGVITETYATGSVNSDGSAGGLAGSHFGTINNSFSSGNVAGGSEGSSGGLIGHASLATTTNSYWDIGRSGRMTSAGGTGLTSEQMTQQDFFNGLGFGEEDEFDIVEGFSYPFLKNVSRDVLLATKIDGNEGWRMMGTPFADSLKNFFDEFWNQGIDGADTDAGLPNILRWEELQQSFVSPASMDEQMFPGVGHIVFIYEDDDPIQEGVDGGFPKFKFTNAPLKVDPVTFELIATDENENEVIDNDEGWNFYANPFPKPVSVDALLAEAQAADANLNLNVYIWDNNEGTDGEYVTLSQGNNEAIAPLQGFFLRSMTPGLNTEFDLIMDEVEAEGVSQAQFHKQQNRAVAHVLRLSIEGQGIQQSWEAIFQQEADQRRNVFFLPPFSGKGINVYSSTETGKYTRQFFDIDAANKYKIPLYIETSIPGVFGMSLFSQVPDDWGLQLIDNKTGQVVDLKQTSIYEFEIDTEAKTVQKQHFVSPPQRAEHPRAIKPKTTVSTRFTLIVTPGEATSDEPGFNLPKTIGLDQNYPNPFNPATVIRYRLPADNRVELRVFDMLGREVAVLVDGRVKAGFHEINFNAQGLASGVYLYRLRTGNTILTKKLTLIK